MNVNGIQLFNAVMVLLALIVYLAPCMVAKTRKHRRYEPIFWLTVLTGWTFVGWVCALIWSMIDDEPQEPDEPEFIKREDLPSNVTPLY
jgi:hypothetical protein